MKFKFYDKIEVVGGFYEGVKGNVTDYNEQNEYLVESLHNINSYHLTELKVWVNEEYLRRI